LPDQKPKPNPKTPVVKEPDIWSKLDHFTREENWGDVSKIDHELLRRLDQFRDFIKKPMFITCGTQGEHSKKSQHYLGRAVDVVVPTWEGDLLDLYLTAERFGFRGIGLYKHWEFSAYPGNDPFVVGGLHLDTRVYEDDPDHINHARWLGVVIKEKQVYTTFTLKNLKLFGFI
jgi:hypothetical protein